MLVSSAGRRALLVILVLTAATGYFVAQEFAYMAVDRGRTAPGGVVGGAGQVAHRRGWRDGAEVVGDQPPGALGAAVPRFARGVRWLLSGLNGVSNALLHIREVVRATATGGNPTARAMMTTPLTLAADLPVARAVTAMRGARSQLALVADADHTVVGIAALEDLLEQLIGEFDDETDRERVVTT